MTETGKLDGRVAVVTGGGGGIGRAICLALASAGAEVVVADLDENSGRATTADVERGNGSARFQQLDVTDEASWKELYDHLWDTSRRLDIVVNNAGIFLLRHIEETTVEEWDAVMAVNAKGVFLGTKLAVKLMKETGGGSVINISSASGITGSPFEGAYTASKGAVRLFTKSAALRFAPDGIRVNSVHPATVDTGMVDVLWESDPNVKTNVLKAVPLGRLGRPEEIAEANVFLLSDRASYVNADFMQVDGGQAESKMIHTPGRNWGGRKMDYSAS